MKPCGLDTDTRPCYAVSDTQPVVHSYAAGYLVGICHRHSADLFCPHVTVLSVWCTRSHRVPLLHCHFPPHVQKEGVWRCLEWVRTSCYFSGHWWEHFVNPKGNFHDSRILPMFFQNAAWCALCTFQICAILFKFLGCITASFMPCTCLRTSLPPPCHS